ncbi:hypothetical protein TW95_gp1594 [Pandoravirus inopinatum]|uniref:Uncharacterized protein n=1 Tax=Pandoravirus inopinatum TaxID=1605721 RepID=A0A0B5IZJ7_9VIRU|nr:hypothetical protein TW95_gp1594 [Pandoravirus inopinatum]AJF98328.1 hypothetical protein [Pandoravirus inopinatum]
MSIRDSFPLLAGAPIRSIFLCLIYFFFLRSPDNLPIGTKARVGGAVGAKNERGPRPSPHPHQICSMTSEMTRASPVPPGDEGSMVVPLGPSVDTRTSSMMAGTRMHLRMSIPATKLVSEPKVRTCGVVDWPDTRMPNWDGLVVDALRKILKVPGSPLHVSNTISVALPVWRPMLLVGPAVNCTGCPALRVTLPVGREST